MIDITWFGETDDRMDKDIGLARSSGSNGKFSMGTMHRVSSLEGNYSSPVKFFKMCSEFSRRNYLSALLTWVRNTSVFNVVVVIESIDGLKFSTYVEFLCFGVKIIYSWMVEIICTENFFSFFDFVWSVDILN